MNFDRRTLLKGVGTGAVSLTFAGYASAEESAVFLIRGQGAERRAEREGLDVRSVLADGQVIVAVGPESKEGDLASYDDVEGVVRDFRFELEAPELREEGDSLDSGGREPAYWDLQWDKHVTDVAPAHEGATGAGSRLAVIDTGIDDTHPDLGNVNTDVSRAFIEGEELAHTGPVHYHATHVAGTAAATGAEGVVGTAPDAELVSIRIFADSGGAYFSDVLLAMEYAAAVGADAANMSIGTPPIPPKYNAGQYRRMMEPVAQTVANAGTLLVGSAGNSDADLQKGGYFTLPNSLAGVTSVSATGPNDLRTFYSNYGTNEIDVGAPGGGYETLEKTLEEDPEAVEWPFPYNLVLSAVPGGWGWAAGTSMAAPQVTGLAGLVRELAPDANAHQVEEAIKSGAELSDGESDPDLGAGRINALNTVETL